MSLTTIKAEITEILIELETLSELKGNEHRAKELLRRIRDDKYHNALAVTPELRQWMDKVIAQFAKTYTKNLQP